MKTDKWWVSAAWGRLGVAIILIVAAALRGQGFEVDQDMMDKAFTVIQNMIDNFYLVIGAGMAILSKFREGKKAKVSKVDGATDKQAGTGVLEVVFGIFLAIGAIVYAIAGDDEADSECYAAQNAAYYAQVELKEVTCSGNDCTVMVNGMPLKLNCSCEAHGSCRRAE